MLFVGVVAVAAVQVLEAVEVIMVRFQVVCPGISPIFDNSARRRVAAWWRAPQGFPLPIHASRVFTHGAPRRRVFSPRSVPNCSGVSGLSSHIVPGYESRFFQTV